VSCASYDWKAYALGELSPVERRDAEAHASTCTACRDELAGFRLTLDALSTLRDEEVPRRIAFVSDKVFKPTWWQELLRPSFAAGCVIAAAILVHAFVRPASQVDLQARIDTSVARAVADTELRHEKQLEEILANYEMIDKQNKLNYIRNTGLVRQ
jgi:anti-sigma factor RsiW